MNGYEAPLEDIRFSLQAVGELDGVLKDSDLDSDAADAVLAEASRFARDVLAPLNHSGDKQGCTLENGVVRSPDGFRDAYRQFIEAGWNSVRGDADYGGQGFPFILCTALNEIWGSANLSFSLCPLLTQSAIKLLSDHGSEEQKALYLPKLISGEWNGTMNLTEPQAGSDLSAIRTTAEKDGDVYRLKGQKIFISYGETDLTENIVHMVLARTPDAPEGVRGISLFMVPKFIPENDGSPGARNDVRALSLEHKLGLHASPTALMAFGENEGAVGYLVGEENEGLKCMFTMMNDARLGVGVEGVSVAERATQQAQAYAAERIQGYGYDGSKERVSITAHPDVRRMLASMRVRTEAARALSYYAAYRMDMAERASGKDERAAHQAAADFLIPIVKAWCTDQGIHIADTGIQVHGGMGYIEETGAAQYLRDARITSIYEGTNGIQANDLVRRKLARDDGKAAEALISRMQKELLVMEERWNEMPALADAIARITATIPSLRGATESLLWDLERTPTAAYGKAAPYLELWGILLGAWLLAKKAYAAKTAGEADTPGNDFAHAKMQTLRFYCQDVLPEAAARAHKIAGGHDAMWTLPLDPDG